MGFCVVILLDGSVKFRPQTLLQTRTITEKPTCGDVGNFSRERHDHADRTYPLHIHDVCLYAFNHSKIIVNIATTTAQGNKHWLANFTQFQCVCAEIRICNQSPLIVWAEEICMTCDERENAIDVTPHNSRKPINKALRHDAEIVSICNTTHDTKNFGVLHARCNCSCEGTVVAIQSNGIAHLETMTYNIVAFAEVAAGIHPISVNLTCRKSNRNRPRSRHRCTMCAIKVVYI